MRKYIVAFLTVFVPAIATATVPYKDILSTVVQRNVVAGYASFAEKAALLKETIQNVCEGNGSTHNIKQIFLEVKANWAGLDWITFGPITYNDRRQRISFFPDKHGVGAKQIRKYLARKDPDILKDIANGKGSYALQGITLIDRVLYSQKVAKDTYSCQLILASASNLNTIAQELNRSWHEEYVELFTEDLSKQDAVQNVSSILESIRLSLEVIKDQKVGRAYNKGKTPKMSALEYPVSESSLLALKSNLLTVKSCIKDVVADVLTESQKQRIFASIDRAIQQIDSFPNSLKKALTRNPQMVSALYDQLSTVTLLYDTVLKTKFGLQKSFNSLDGD